MQDVTAPPPGFGIGLRHAHYETLLRERPAIGWLEIISDNYIHAHRGYWEYLAALRADYPIAMHGVSLSIGAARPLDDAYLDGLKALALHLEAPWLSDHLCFTGLQSAQTHDLLPIPYTEEALAHLIPRIHYAQERLGRPIAFENASSYLEFDGSTLSEPEMLRELCIRTGCGILLDINNVHVSSFNHGWDALAYIDAIPAERIVEYHLSGHCHKGSHILDTHDAPVAGPVWELYRYAVRQKGLRPTLIEWDEALPELPVLLAEMHKARQFAREPEGQAA